jgi:hypothetical protein
VSIVGLIGRGLQGISRRCFQKKGYKKCQKTSPNSTKIRQFGHHFPFPPLVQKGRNIGQKGTLHRLRMRN